MTPLRDQDGPALRQWSVLACGAVALCWFVIDGLLLPPAFGGTDFYYFKDPSLNLATGLGFVTRFTFGSPGLADQVYAMYPPIYPLLFGLFVKLFGISAQTNQAFNAALGVALGAAGFLAGQRLLERGPSRRTQALIGAFLVLAIVTRLYAPDPERPDGLGVLLGLAALIALRQHADVRGEIGAGVLCGVALLVSPFAGVFGLIAVGGVIYDYSFFERGLLPTFRSLLRVAASVFVVLALGAGLVSLFYPGWLAAFLGVLLGTTTNNETGGGYLLALLHGDVRTWVSAFPLSDPSFLVGLGKLLLVQLVLVVAVAVAWVRFGFKACRSSIVLLICASPLCILTSPYQGNYPSITAALLLGAASCIALRVPGNEQRVYRTAVLAGFVALCLVSAPQRARDIVVQVSAGPSLPRALAAIDEVRKDLRADELLGVSPADYVLWRQQGLRPLITTYSGLGDPEKRKQLAYVAVTYGGTGNAREAHLPPWLTDAEYRLVHQPSLPQYATLFGWIVSRSTQTWESSIYVRRDRAQR
jgi:hypothetical protein